jgi:hypothetical protein
LSSEATDHTESGRRMLLTSFPSRHTLTVLRALKKVSLA